MEKYTLYRIETFNAYTGEVIPGVVAYSIKELSYAMPIFAYSGIDSALLHAEIKDSSDWEVRIQGCDSTTNTWTTLDHDPRIHREYLYPYTLDEEMSYLY